MKTNKYLHFVIIILVLTACKKEGEPATTVPVEFKETTYQTLGTFDATGKPSYLLAKDQISSDLLTYVSQNFNGQDLRTTHPDLLSSTAIGDIDITQQSDVFITFVYQNTYLGNAIGFYTYPTNAPPASAKDIKTIIYAFPQAGDKTPLQAGDKVKIGRFDPGTSIGFVLLKSAWSYETSSLNNKAVHFCSNDVLNPEVDPSLKKHVVLVNYAPENKVLIAFEDLDRTTTICDHDFNDLMIYATVTP